MLIHYTLIHYTANTFLFYFQVFLISQPDYDRCLDEQDTPAQWIPRTFEQHTKMGQHRNVW